MITTTSLPAARPSSSATSLVIDDVTTSPPASLTLTAVVTAPGVTSTADPENWLRALILLGASWQPPAYVAARAQNGKPWACWRLVTHYQEVNSSQLDCDPNGLPWPDAGERAIGDFLGGLIERRHLDDEVTPEGRTDVDGARRP
jgi:hypothetical protein